MSLTKTQKFYQKLINSLNLNSKPNISEILYDLNISFKTFQKQLNKLRKEKIINNYTININPNIRPNLKYIFLMIKTNPKEPYIVKELLEISQLVMLDGIFGEFSLFGLFIFKSLEEYYQILSVIDKIMSHSYFKKYQLVEPIKIFKTNGIKLGDISINSEINLDDVDFQILKILHENETIGLLSTYKIKKILKERYKKEISQPTIYNRIKNLKKSNIILNYALNFNPQNIGYKGKFILRIKPIDTSEYEDLANNLESRNEITHLFRIGEEYGLLAIVRLKKIEDYRIFIKNLYDFEDIEDTYTNFVLDELVPYTNFILY